MSVSVPPTYPPGCKVVFCGEAPGREEELAGEGFVGQAGKLLQKVIHASGLTWDEIGRTNVSKRAPDGGYDSEHFHSTFYETHKEGKKKVIGPGSELVLAREVLLQELRECKPDVVVACGAEALSALTTTGGITKQRGSIFRSPVAPVWVVPIIHPSAILRSAQWQELYISSQIIARKVMPILRGEWSGYLPWEQQLAPTIGDFNEWIRSVDGPFALDIETRAGSIACVGLCDRFDRAICVPIQTTRGPYFVDCADECEFWRGLKWLCEKWPVIAQNAFFDFDWLRDYGIVANEVYDTMLLFHRLYPELPKGLDFVSMWYTDIPYYKDDGSTWGFRKPDEQLWEYNVKDCVATQRAFRAMTQGGLPTLYEKHTRHLLPPAFEMQCRGMDADPVGVTFARAVLVTELDKIRSKLSDLSSGSLVVRERNKKITDKQVADYLYGELKLPAKRNRKTKSLTADEDALTELLIQFPKLEVLQAINAERKFGKALNSYIDIKWGDK